MNVKKELFKCKNDKFRQFEANLTPTIGIERIIGVKSPDTKRIAKELFLSNNYKSFINSVPHKYLEENLVHVHLINLLKDYDETLWAIKKLLPYMNSWMETDSIGSRTLEKNKDKLIVYINSCLKSKKTYYIRLGIIFLKKYYLDESFSIEQMNKVAAIKHKDYYVKMMQAWYIADGLIKQEKIFLDLLKKKKLDPFVQNKGIQKARESYRISNKVKKELLKYKI